MAPAAEPPAPGPLPGAAPPPSPSPPALPLADALGRGTVVLDGGLSNQLQAQGCDLSDHLWSARLLADDPAQIVAAHAAYVRAGAQVVITASYQASYEGFARRGLERRQVEALLRRSVHLARQAAGAGGGRAAAPVGADGGGAGAAHGAGPAPRAPAARAGRAEEAGAGRGGPRPVARTGPGGPDGGQCGGGGLGGAEPGADAQPADGAAARAGAVAPEGVWVAASVGPYGAVLADGSEYRGGYGLSVRELAEFHRPRIAALAQARPDVLALETVPDLDEAEAMLGAAEDCGVPVWLSYSVEGSRTRAGQPLERAFALAAGREQVIAVGVNCCTPADADAAVRLAAQVTGKPVVVYPNSGEGWDATERDWRGPSTFDPERVAAWQSEGARLIGGCCRVGPDRIADLAIAVRR